MEDFIINHSDLVYGALGAIIALFLKGLTEFITEIIKSTFGNREKNAEEKRKTYIQLINSMGIFIEGKFIGDQYTQAQVNFNIAYDYLWLWGNNELIKKLGDYLENAKELTQIENDRDNQERSNDIKSKMKDKHKDIILLMRKDLGLSNKKLSRDDYTFFKLN